MNKTNTARKAATTVATAIVETPAVEAPKFPSTDEMIAKGLTTKSARIRHLYAAGMSIGAIAKQETGGLYQHAYNVIKKPLKRPETSVAEDGAKAEATPPADVAPEATVQA